MKKFVLAALAFTLVNIATAQTGTPSTTTSKTPTKKDWSKVNLGNRANDHFMIQFGYDGWAAAPDSINTKGFSRHFNMYFMYDMPFKTDPRFSIGAGLGVGSSNIFFNKQEVAITALTSQLPFPDKSQTDHFKKFKLSTNYIEVPLELRFVSNPENTNKSFKAAAGIKVGFLVNAHTKGKTLQNSDGQTINNYTEKEASKRYFNTTKIAATARLGYGFLGIHFDYQITSTVKDGMGPAINPYSIGLVVSGL
ncbi:outer membrane beta-barrel protein [Pinibacter soli]|uniref:Outer membrane beta-barrel protein n=1 Tax=Pinibacter soli TaxID=3044211 RepID=A0ABT6R864_9BACT|nr:outer membrane beta-barrel protein [Pinibacter soli]MDI3318753.1 outer membrane beta-barrel protein [Pinibacter soli]